MLIRQRRTWEIPERLATPEAVFLNRRALIGGAAGLMAASWLGDGPARAAGGETGLYPARRNEAFVLDRALTPEAASGNYNNFYEFSLSKSVLPMADRLKVKPWSVGVDGLVDKPFEIGVDDLVKKIGLEERLYRHRCVEAWSMAVPWTGFPLAKLIALAKPASGAKYVQLTTFLDRATAPGQRTFYPWPYSEGLTLAEAATDLAFVATGIYGKPLPNQFGAPIRLVVPWKYGFKSIKSIVKVTLTAERPKTFWEALGPSEYGFWANVNPAVPHPRWSQATERVLGTDERVRTLLFNGYGEQVAGLYKGLESESLYM